MRVLKSAAVLVVLLSGSSVLWAGEPVAVSSKAGNLGVGLDLTMGLKPDVNLRLGFLTAGSVVDVGVDRSASAVLDWHLGHSPFRLSGGLGVLRQGRLEDHYTSVAPYVGVGWGNAVLPGSRLRFVLDAGTYYSFGVMYRTDAAGASSTATAPLILPKSNVSGSNGRLSYNLGFEPLVSMGLSYRF